MQHNWRELFNYNPDTGELFWKINRRARKVKGKRAGHNNITGYVHIKYKEKLYKAHRIAYELYHNETIPDGMHIDHINRQRDDNRIDNLRCVTPSENFFNKGGLHIYQVPSKKGGSWKAVFRGTYLGQRKTKEEALKLVENYRKKCEI